MQIWDSAVKQYGNNMGSGGLFNNKKHSARPLLNADKPIGEWNAMLIRMVGEKVTISLNGQLVVDEVVFENYFAPDQPIYSSGPIELQKFGSPLQFRNVLIRELKASSTIGRSQGTPPPAIAPFDAAQAKKHQEAWARHLGVPVEYTNSIGMKFRLIPPGEFTMGSTPAEIEAALVAVGGDEYWKEHIRSEAPKHPVILTQPIYLGIHEITQAEYEKVMGTNPSHFSPLGAGKETVVGMDTTRHPVEMVSWNDAAEFCMKLSQQEKLKPFYFRAGETITPLDGTGYRLPTEAEWEHACRAGTTTKYWIGDKDEDLVRAGWFNANSGLRTHVVGELKANPFGLFDIHGNAWEWVQDWWEPTYYGSFAGKPALDPNGPSSAGSHRVRRGGYWHDAASHCRASIRLASDPSSRGNSIGFRVSLAVDAVKETLKQKPSTATSPLVAPNPANKLSGPQPPVAKAPFDAKQARAHQEAWAKHLSTTVETTNSIGAKMILIPPGEFLMGSTDEQVAAALKVAEEFQFDPGVKDRIQKAERPQHRVVIAKPFLMGATEITVGQFKKFGTTGYKTEAEKAEIVAKAAPPQTLAPGQPAPKPPPAIPTYLNPGYAVTDDSPAAMITWNDAVAFCQWLSTQEKTHHRLPTEAEWEYACRAGTTTQYSFGDDMAMLDQYGWHHKNSGGKSHPVGTRPPNGFGLHDMHGNLYEWCGDFYEDKWYETSLPSDLNGPASGSDRVIRGGNFYNVGPRCRSAFRSYFTPSDRINNHGIRVVRTLNAPSTTASVTPQPTVAATSSGKLFMHDPAFPQWVKDVQAMPAEKQIEAVSKKLVELNPGFDGKINRHVIESGVVKAFYFSSSDVADLSPIRALADLAVLQCPGSIERRALSDISPLKGLRLSVLNVGNSNVSNLLPLAGMRLSEFYANNSQISDLAALRGMPLIKVSCLKTQVADLTPLAASPISFLSAWGTPVSDLAPLATCASLESLNVGRTQVTPAAVAALQKALPNCKIEWDDPAKPKTPADPDRQAAEWVFSYGNPSTYVFIQEPGKESAEAKSLDALPLGPFKVVQIRIRGGMIRPGDLLRLSRLQALKHLHLNGLDLSAIELNELKDASALTEFLPFQSRLPDNAFVAIGGLTKLTYLDIHSTTMTDADLKHLEVLKDLRTLLIKDTKVTPAGVATLQKALPNCKIEWDDPAKPKTPQPAAPDTK